MNQKIIIFSKITGEIVNSNPTGEEVLNTAATTEEGVGTGLIVAGWSEKYHECEIFKDTDDTYSCRFVLKTIPVTEILE